MADDPASTYTYGDNAVAGDRLAVLASIFGPTTETFLERDAPSAPDLAVDLGCGPGYTTVLVARTTEAVRTVGLEQSDAFVLRARIEHGGGSVEFLPHDVTETPFPVGPADLVFARYLLAHLPDPVAVRDRWLDEVRPGGRLLVEEIDGIDTSVDTFATYLDVVQEMSRGHGTELLVGSALAVSPPPPGSTLVADTTAPIAPDPRTVARIFAMNLSVWRDDPWSRANVPTGVIGRLERELPAIAADPAAGAPGAITWHHRQLAYRRS